MTEYFWQCSFCLLTPYDRPPNNFNCLSTCLNCLPVLAFNILLLLQISTTYFQVVVIFSAKACLRLLNSKLNCIWVLSHCLSRYIGSWSLGYLWVGITALWNKLFVTLKKLTFVGHLRSHAPLWVFFPHMSATWSLYTSGHCQIAETWFSMVEVGTPMVLSYLSFLTEDHSGCGARVL